MTMSSHLHQQLPHLAPALLAYFVGGVVGLAFLRRHPSPAVLVLSGCTLLFVATAAFAVVQAGLLSSAEEQGAAFGVIRERLVIAGAVRSLLYVAGFWLVLNAVFVDRRRAGPPR